MQLVKTPLFIFLSTMNVCVILFLVWFLCYFILFIRLVLYCFCRCFDVFLCVCFFGLNWNLHSGTLKVEYYNCLLTLKVLSIVSLLRTNKELLIRLSNGKILQLAPYNTPIPHWACNILHREIPIHHWNPIAYFLSNIFITKLSFTYLQFRI